MNKIYSSQDESLSENSKAINECPICFEKFHEKLRRTKLENCIHSMCELCFTNLVKYENKCPLCKSHFLKAFIYNHNNTHNLENNNIEDKTIKLSSEEKQKEIETTLLPLEFITYELNDLELEIINNHKQMEKEIGKISNT